MKQIKTKSGDIVVIESNSEAYLIDPIDNPKFKYSIRFIDCPEINYIKYKRLEPLGKLSELTDEDCEEFVKNPNQWVYFDYTKKSKFNMLSSAKESFISLLQSEGIDTSKELLIIKLL